MVRHFWSTVDTVLIMLAGIILLASIMHVTADVAMKYFLSRPIPGTIVYVSNFYMTMIVFLPLASAELRNQHVYVDLWPQRVPRWLDMISMRFNWALSSLIYFLLAWNTLKDAMRKQSEGEYVLDQSGLIITWPSYYVLPLGFVVIGCLLAAKIVKPQLSIASDEAQTDG